MLKSSALAILFFSLTQSSSVYAFTKTHQVYVRNDETHQIELQEHALEDLVDPGFAEGKHFKVVDQKSETPIALDGSEMGIRAASVYHNLTTARKFWVNLVGESGLEHIGHLTVRLDITNQFTDLARFMNDSLAPSYNNATSIPKSDDEKLDNYPSWNYEIWFRPQKEVSEKTALAAFDEASKNKAMYAQVRFGLLNNALTQYAQMSVRFDTLINPKYHLKQIAVNFAITEAVPKVLGVFGRMIKRKVFLDTATIPEVAYHEYTHIALAKTLPIGNSTPVLEGIANFFAMQIMGYDKIIAKLGDHGKARQVMSGKKWSRYSQMHEQHSYSWENLTLEVLCHLADEFSDETMQKALLLSIQKMESYQLGGVSKANIRVHLTDALHSALSSLSAPNERFNVAYRINTVLDRMGF